MSLLLQALQKAAKSRESGIPASDAITSHPEQVESTGLNLPSPFSLSPKPKTESTPREPELALEDDDLYEPVEEAAPAAAGTARAGDRFDPYSTAATASSTQAANVLRASKAPTATWFDGVREKPVHWFAGLAAVFLVGYFLYVWLQLSHPEILRGEFGLKRLAATTPPPLTQPIKSPSAPVSTPAPPAKPAAPVAGGLPSGTPLPGPAAATAPTPAGTASNAGELAGLPLPGNVLPAQLGKPETGASGSTAAPSAPMNSVRQTFPSSDDAGVVAPRPARVAGSEPRRQRKQPAPAPALADTYTTQPAQANLAPVSATLSQAYQALQSGKLDPAEAAYRSVVQSDPNNVDAMLGLATVAAQRGNAQQAIGYYERALELEPRNAAAQAGMIAIIGQADPQLSETRLKQLIAREPEPYLYFGLGNLYARQGLWAPAQAAYFQAYQMQPDNPDYAYNLAIGLEHLSQSKLALTYYRRAIDLSLQKGHANFDQSRVIDRIGQLSARTD